MNNPIDKFAAETVVLPEERWTDNGRAERFIDQYGEQFRFCVTWNKWLAWDGKRWSIERGDNLILERSRNYADDQWQIAIDAATLCDPNSAIIARRVNRCNSCPAIKAVVDLSRADSRVSISHKDLDSHPYLFNCINGTYDLKSGNFRKHQREDLITQVANVSYLPGADCPLWMETLDHIFAGDTGLIEYVQTLIGYSLAGITDEHILPVCCGDGNNGKSTFWNTIFGLAGDYAWLANQELLMPTNYKAHPTEMAALFGKRFVAISEPEQGCKLAESKVKELTGDAIITARRMREDFWQFLSTHTFWMSTNHKPMIIGTDLGIWRRVKVIPFSTDLSDVVEVDKGFPDKLKAEYSGILNWALEGWKRYQDEGLVDPETVIQATAEYRASEDIVGEFIRETYIENPGFEISSDEAFQAFAKWGGKLTKKALGIELSKRYEKSTHASGKYRGKVVYQGIGLLPEN